MKTLLYLLGLLLVLPAALPARADVPVFGVEVVASYPHDPDAYTEGLFWRGGYLYESTGEVGQSGIRKVNLETGEVVQREELLPPYYGEGIIALGGKLYQLTWKSGTGFIYDVDSFEKLGRFEYTGQGWGMTTDGESLYMSDGTAEIRALDPDTLEVVRRITVTLNGKEITRINELEWIRGQIWANVWLTPFILQIDPTSGKVTAVIDLRPLIPARSDVGNSSNAVLNGIAWDKQHNRIFVTGKNWRHLYQIKLKGDPPHHQHEKSQ